MIWAEAEISGWGKALAAHAYIARPERASALVELSRLAPAIGLRRSYGDAALNGGGRLVEMTRLDRLLGFDPQTGELEVEAGARLSEIARIMAPKGWGLPVLAGTGFVTVGGAIANDIHGKNHPLAGSFAQNVAAISLISHGVERRVLPHEPLFAATAGGLGQTGIIAAARLRLVPRPSAAMRILRRRVAGLDGLLAALLADRSGSAVAWVDAAARGHAFGRGILETAEPAEAAPRHWRAGQRVPFDAPAFLLSPPVVRAANALRWRCAANGAALVPAPAFQFPLDRLRDWNRLYGVRGLYQFQCVLPEGAENRLATLFETVTGAGLVAPLAVLKRLGAGRAGLLSFPRAGLSLALDLPASEASAAVIGKLNRMTAEAGGRVYLAKDALLTPDLVREMYPELGAWQEAVAAIDPEHVYATDLVRRLRLKEAA